MSLLHVFKMKTEVVSITEGQDQVRAKLESETVFDQEQPRGWRYRNAGKRFIGFMHQDSFFLIQKPMAGTRYGAVVQGTVASLGQKEKQLELRSWVDPRATRKIIFGCFLSVFIIARITREQFFGGGVNPESILPYFLLAAIPMTVLGAHLYDRNRNEAFEYVKQLFSEESSR